ncbi:MAG: hypothetical protein WCJ31_12000 [Planctomycetia bacterium]
MVATRDIGARVLEGLRELERRWIRPLGQRLRPPRERRQKARGGSPEAEELLVALLRARLRDGGAALSPDLPAMPCASELEALVRALVDVPPRHDVAAVESLRKVA